MRILAVTNMYPSPEWPADAVFVEQQVKGLQAIGLQVRVTLIDRRREGPLVYYRMTPTIRGAVSQGVRVLLLKGQRQHAGTRLLDGGGVSRDMVELLGLRGQS